MSSQRLLKILKILVLVIKKRKIYMNFIQRDYKIYFCLMKFFEIDSNYTTNATDCYNSFVNFCVNNNVDVPTQTAFGLNMCKFAKKIRTRTGINYNVKIKEIINE